MGKRDQYETVTGVIKAFADNHCWRQAELARRLNIEARSLRKVLLGLQEKGMPLHHEEEHPHVIWSVPKKWFPGGVFLDHEDWELLVQVVLRIPDEARRKKILTRLLNGRVLGNVDTRIERLERGIAAQPITPEVHQATMLVQDAVMEQHPLRMTYYSASSGSLKIRVISPQKLVTEPHARLAAYCHSNHQLRWFRLDNVQRMEIDGTMQLHEVDVEEVERFIAASPDGFHDGTETEWSFVVSRHAAPWVKGNLLPGMFVDSECSDGMRVTVRGGALVVARFIVGLGGDAVAEQEQLRRLVRELADKALGAHED
jgi:predicted DNA-binding transcriptional regulator YafY